MNRSQMLLSGIYCFKNEKTKTIYIGETQRTFLLRYIEHINDLGKSSKQKRELLLSNDTKFKLILPIHPRESELLFQMIERHYMDLYKAQGYTVISKPSTKLFVDNNELLRIQNNITKSYLKREDLRPFMRTYFIRMVKVIAKKNNKIPQEVYGWSYKDIEKHFNVSLVKRQKDNPKSKKIDLLKHEELEYILLRLLTKYSNYAKMMERNVNVI